jgi:hypothetical protein
MSNKNHLPPPEVLFELGRRLQQEYRSAGLEPPAGLTPEQFAESTLDMVRQAMESRGRQYQRLFEDTQAELGSDATFDHLREVFYTRLKEAATNRGGLGPFPAA